MKTKGHRLFIECIVISILVSSAGCSLPVLVAPGATATRTLEPSRTPTSTNTPTLELTATPTIVPTITQTPFPQPEGCRRPPNDSTILEVNGEQINARTYAMLQYAADLYGGEIDIADKAITQGSYTDSVSLSFGTHAGGGAVDISVIRVENNNWIVLWDQVDPLIEALRVAGFAAWFRAYGELSPKSPIHIHAVAIGDPGLSEAAQAQLTGTYGYFLGYSGIPQDNGIPVKDRHGGPVLCEWMVDLGYQDLTQSD